MCVCVCFCKCMISLCLSRVYTKGARVGHGGRAGGADGGGGRVNDGGAAMHVEAAAEAWVVGGLSSRFKETNEFNIRTHSNSHSYQHINTNTAKHLNTRSWSVTKDRMGGPAEGKASQL